MKTDATTAAVRAAIPTDAWVTHADVAATTGFPADVVAWAIPKVIGPGSGVMRFQAFDDKTKKPVGPVTFKRWR